MTANVNVTKVLFKRGNTVQNAAYTGINGEITVDTQAKTLRIHDGVTTGGNVIVAGGVVGSYSNTNAAAYIPTDSTITTIQSNVTAANLQISNLQSNAATQQTQINLLNANVVAANALIPNLLAISGNIIPSANVTYSLGSSTRQWRDLWVSNNTIYIGNVPLTVSNGNLLVNGSLVTGSGSGTDDVLRANVGAYQIFANANAATQATSINTFNTNLGAYQTFANSNAATQATSINTVNANIGAYQTFANSNAATQATSINTFNANLGAYQTFANSNAATQSTAIATLQTQVYANANVAEYLPTYSGNVRAEYVIMSFGGLITTGASPAPIISGFRSISTAGNAPNEGNITASGNLVANRGAYITGNVTAGNINASQYNFANGVNILSAVGAGSYGNANVATYLSNYNGDINFTSSTAIISNVDVITVGAHIQSPAYQFSNGTSILAGITGTYSNTNVAAYLTTATITTTGNITAGNVSAVNFVGTIQAQVGSSFAYATDAYGSLFNTGGVPLPADTNSNAIVAGYTIVGNSGAVTLTVTSATFIPGTPNIVQVATTPTASSLAYPVTVYSANYSPAIPVSTITVGNATVSGNVIAPNYLFANGVSILAGITGTYSNTNVAAYLTTATIATTGNITAGNLTTSGTFTVANITTTGTYGNITGANVISANTVSATNITTANLTTTGNVVQQSAYYETYANVTNSGGNLTCNFVNGATFYATLTANVTVNFTNVVATAGRVTGATLIVDQGATAYRVANIQINSGGVQTIKYAGGTPNTGTASNTDIMSFSLISLDGTNWRVLGQISNYG